MDAESQVDAAQPAGDRAEEGARDPGEQRRAGIIATIGGSPSPLGWLAASGGVGGAGAAR